MASQPSAFADQVRAELKRRYGVPFPDGLRDETARAEVLGISAGQLVADWGALFGLADLPERISRSRA